MQHLFRNEAIINLIKVKVQIYLTAESLMFFWGGGGCVACSCLVNHAALCDVIA
jgi:hypothetical protein